MLAGYDARMHERFDVAVVGGGPVGTLAALAFARLGLRSALVEARAPGPPLGDGRVFALAAGSVALLQALAVWPRVAADSTAIRSVRVSAEGVFGTFRLDAEDLALPALGATVPAELLASALEECLKTAPIRVFRPCALLGIEARDALSDRLTLRLRGPDGMSTLEARLLLGADGAQSSVRRLAGIAASPCGNPDRLLLANLASARVRPHIAHLRFARDGAAALVPSGGGRLAGVLSLGGDADAAVEDPARAFQARIGWSLGALSLLAPPRIHAVAPERAERLIGWRVVLIGQAAMSLHPLAAQGLNLALRDLAALVEAVARSEDPGAERLLAAYEEARLPEHRRTLGFVEGLRSWFAPPRASSLATAVGMLLCDRLSGIKHALAAWASGRGPPVPALLRGVLP